MAKKTSVTGTAPSASKTDSDVEAFLAALEHPFKAEILLLRDIILGADPAIAEGIKWNAPSFRTAEYFATFHLRAAKGVQVIFHLGAKKRALPAGGIKIADSRSLLEWLAVDRATVKLRDSRDIESKRAALTALVREWIVQL